MEILKLSAYYYPEKTASSHLVEDTEKAFIEAGYTIKVITPIPTRNISKEERKYYKKNKKEKRFDGKIIVERFNMFQEKNNSLQRMIRYFLCNIIQYYKAIHQHESNVILSGSTPPTQGILAAKVKKRLHIPFIYILQDIFPDSLVNAKMTQEGSLIWKIGRKIEDNTYKQADKIIVISDDYKKNIINKGVPEDKIIVIPNWINTDNVIPVERKDNILVNRYKIDPNKFILCYSGNIGHSQNLSLLLELAKRIKDNTDIQIIIIGEGAQKEELKSEKEKYNLSNVTILPFQEYKDISYVFSLGDVGLLISKKGVGLTSVPSKTWGIMSAGRPVLASIDKGSYASALIDKIGCGYTADADDIDTLQKALFKLYKNKKLCEEMGNKGRAYVTKELNKDIATKKYLDAIRMVL